MIHRVGTTIYFKNLNQPESVTYFIKEVEECIKSNIFDLKLDFQNVSTIYPNVAAPIAGLINYYQYEQKIQFRWERYRMHPIIRSSYMLAPGHGIRVDAVDPSKVLNRVWKFRNYDEAHTIASTLILRLMEEVLIQESSLLALEWALSETMDNVLTHCGTSEGYFMAQIHHNTGHVAVCIFDYGCGIKESLSKNPFYSPNSQIDAIKLAVQEGVTGVHTSKRGNGLWGLHRIIDMNNGSLQITSGDGAYRLKSGRSTTHRFTKRSNIKLRSTTIDFQLDPSIVFDVNHALTTSKMQSTYVLPNLIIERFENEFNEPVFLVKDMARDTRFRNSGENAYKLARNLLRQTTQSLIIDFDKIAICSSSFLDGFIGSLSKSLGKPLFESRVKLQNLNPVLEYLIRKSIAQHLE